MTVYSSVAVERLESRVAELEAQVAALTQERDALRKALQDELDNWNPEARPTITARAEAAEAALAQKDAALTKETERAIAAEGEAYGLRLSLADTRRALAEARDHLVRVADKELGRLSNEARAIHGRASTILGDLPSADDVAGILADLGGGTGQEQQPPPPPEPKVSKPPQELVPPLWPRKKQQPPPPEPRV